MYHFLGGLCGGYVGVSCLGGNTTLCKHLSLVVNLSYEFVQEQPHTHCQKHSLYADLKQIPLFSKTPPPPKERTLDLVA